MRPFVYSRADSVQTAISAQTGSEIRPDTATVHAAPSICCRRHHAHRPHETRCDAPAECHRHQRSRTHALRRNRIWARGLHLGALVRMSAAAENSDVRSNYPVIAQALELAASPQIRNMATLGGNVLQRTRCSYFRDTSYSACNKRNPGSGCAAMMGVNRAHAVLGTTEQCIAAYPSDFAQALIALDAEIELAGPKGSRRIPFAKLHRPLGDTPHIETRLEPGELILAFMVPPAPWAKRSLYLKIRDRESIRVRVGFGRRRPRSRRRRDPRCSNRAWWSFRTALAGA